VNGDARESIRRAIASEEFLTAQRLWNAYAEKLEAAIVDGTANEAMMADTRELVAWSRLMVQSFRAHAADQLNRSHVARAYFGGDS
jgi:hypothetical protein